METLQVAAAQNGTSWKKYPRYELEVDPTQNDKAKEIKLCDFSRPHMRAFHCCWWSFFIAFFSWFAIGPIMTDIRKDLGISKREVWTSSIASVGSTIAIRFLLGPLCDKYGARVLYTVVLCTTAIPTALTGLIRNAQELIILRLFIGLAGGTFVMCEYWSSVMFAKEIVGTANALVAGWGNLGAGMTQLVMGSAIVPLVKVLCNGDTSLVWRTVCIVPAVISFISGVVVYFISDDCPKGNYSELKKHGQMGNISATKLFIEASLNVNTWILFIQYACCFGVELTMNSAATMYFKDEFGQSTETAGAIASIFGWMNLFARGLGGFISDYANAKNGMRGRLAVQAIFLLFEGALVLIFGTSNSLGGSIISMVFFSLFVQACEGASYAIVPYVIPHATGAVSGIVGAGGNVGAVCFQLVFRELDYKVGFQIMGTTIMISGLMTICIKIKGYAGLFFGDDLRVDQETGVILDENFKDEEQATS